MPVFTILMDFQVSPSYMKSSQKQKDFQTILIQSLKEHYKHIELVNEFTVGEGFIMILTGPELSIITVRGYSRGTVTISIDWANETCVEESLLTYKSTQEFKRVMENASPDIQGRILVPLKRGGRFERYFATADERVIEYDIDSLVYECRSLHQKVQIFHSKFLGNMLVLDDNQNMSEADLIYTETLMQKGKESYEGKEIVILGGGDGSLLWELLKENPKYVTMLELDEAVITGCNEHMKSICGDCLDKRKGDNYEIIIGDCFDTLSKMAKENRKVDYVFGDLTEIPIIENNKPFEDDWEFTKLTLNSAIEVLKPGTGKFMTHGNSAALEESLEMYESELSRLSVPVTFTKDVAYIPSFYEKWVFYQISVV